MFDFSNQLAAGLTYEAFLERYANPDQRRRWDDVFAAVKLTDAQRETLAGFRRELTVLCVAGAWCGDCVNQCPIFEHFVRENGLVQVLYYDRDDHPALAEELSVCGGKRVPSLVFLSEDGYPCGRYGDRTIAKYRQMAADQLGAACPTGTVPGHGLLEAADFGAIARQARRLNGRPRPGRAQRPAATQKR
jgi:thiol-disulfide isomerase/thioredoxin